MSLILCIDTSLEVASVCLARKSGIIALETNETQVDHASWIHNAIHALFRGSGSALQDVAAVAVASGPGSYTGLRVGMATAKGLCYALSLPLLTENTLKLIAKRMKAEKTLEEEGPVLFCPMIDARRNEVFTAIYDNQLNNVTPPSALILEEGSFAAELEGFRMFFGGNGAIKWEKMLSHPNAVFTMLSHKPEDLAEIAHEKLEKRDFADLAYAEPDYFKNVYTGK